MSMPKFQKLAKLLLPDLSQTGPRAAASDTGTRFSGTICSEEITSKNGAGQKGC